MVLLWHPPSSVSLYADPAVASQASDLLGVLAFGDYAAGGGRDADQAGRAASAFGAAVRLDPGNDAAKVNLELVLRLFAAHGVRPGASSSDLATTCCPGRVPAGSVPWRLARKSFTRPRAGAAVQAARLGRSVLLLEETDWIGGQMTAAAVTSAVAARLGTYLEMTWASPPP